MADKKIKKVATPLFLISLSTMLPTLSYAIGGGGEFESRMQDLTGMLINVVLPLFSVAGLLYAVFLALMGDAAAKTRLWTVGICSMIGFLAPQFIAFIKMATGY